jgi:hypothetical protein
MNDRETNETVELPDGVVVPVPQHDIITHARDERPSAGGCMAAYMTLEQSDRVMGALLRSIEHDAISDANLGLELIMEKRARFHQMIEAQEQLTGHEASRLIGYLRHIQDTCPVYTKGDGNIPEGHLDDWDVSLISTAMHHLSILVQA